MYIATEKRGFCGVSSSQLVLRKNSRQYFLHFFFIVVMNSSMGMAGMLMI